MRQVFSLISVEDNSSFMSKFHRPNGQPNRYDCANFLKNQRSASKLFAEKLGKKIGAKFFYLPDDLSVSLTKLRLQEDVKTLVGHLRGRRFFYTENPSGLCEHPCESAHALHRLIDIIDRRLSEGRQVVHIAMNSSLTSYGFTVRDRALDIAISYDSIREHERLLASQLKFNLAKGPCRFAVKLNPRDLAFDSKILRVIKSSHSHLEYRGLQIDIHPRIIGRHGTSAVIDALAGAFTESLFTMDVAEN